MGVPLTVGGAPAAFSDTELPDFTLYHYSVMILSAQAKELAAHFYTGSVIKNLGVHFVGDSCSYITALTYACIG